MPRACELLAAAFAAFELLQGKYPIDLTRNGMPRPGFEPGSSAIFVSKRERPESSRQFCVAGLDDRGCVESVSCV